MQEHRVGLVGGQQPMQVVAPHLPVTRQNPHGLLGVCPQEAPCERRAVGTAQHPRPQGRQVGEGSFGHGQRQTVVACTQLDVVQVVLVVQLPEGTQRQVAARGRNRRRHHGGLEGRRAAVHDGQSSSRASEGAGSFIRARPPGGKASWATRKA